MQYASFNTRVLTFIVKCRYAFVAYMFIGAATQDRKETVGLVDTTVGHVLVGTIVVGVHFAVFSRATANEINSATCRAPKTESLHRHSISYLHYGGALRARSYVHVLVRSGDSGGADGSVFVRRCLPVPYRVTYGQGSRFHVVQRRSKG